MFCKFLFIRYALDLELCHHSSRLTHPRTHGPLRPRRVVPSNAPVISLATSNFNHAVFLCPYHCFFQTLIGSQRGSSNSSATPLDPRFFLMKIIFFVDPHWIVNRLVIYQGWPIPGKLCVVSHNGYWNSLKNSFL